MSSLPITSHAARPLVMSTFTLRNATFEQRCQAAAAAGFDGFGIYVGHYADEQARGHSDADLVAMAAHYGVRVLEVEVAILDEAMDRMPVAAHLCELFGAHHLQVVAPFHTEVPFEVLAERARRAADMIGPAKVAFEFLPFSCVKDWPAAQRLVEMADHPGVGVCIDSWHVFRGSGLASLATVVPELVVGIQFNDGPRVPVLDDYLQDCLHHRCSPGEGEFDLAGFLAALVDVPAEAPIGLEVIDDDLDLLPPVEAAVRVADATRSLIGRRE
jgi:sugar phosphate isomerase/epimerase